MLKSEAGAHKNGLNAIWNGIGDTIRVGCGERRTEKLELRRRKGKLRMPKNKVLA
jgi:hypothetical protein